MEIEIKNIILDDFIYARSQKDLTNVAVLVEKLKAGIKLDAIEIQEVSNYNGDDAILLINGGHRLQAYEDFNKLEDYEKVEPSFKWYKEERLDYKTHRSELAIVAHNRNDDQGLNSRTCDTKKIARNLKRENPDWTQAQIGRELRRSQNTISGYIDDIVQEQKASDKQKAVRLSRLGWTQSEIGKELGKTQGRIAQIINNIDSDIINNFYDEGKHPSQIASMVNLDIQTVWSVLLEGKSDDEKVETLTQAYEGITIHRDDDVWNYNQCFDLTGRKYAGRVPGQIVINLLRWFTNQNDLVVDPMAGGGTTLDACLLMNRRCLGFDKKPCRDDIRQHEITDGYPEGVKKANLIFLDPPYFKKKAKDYELPEELCTKEGFLNFAQSWVKFCKEGLKKNGLVALLISDFIDYDDEEMSIFSDEYARLFEADGFIRKYKISVPLSTQQYRPDQILRAREEKSLLIRGRELYILRR